MRHLIIAAVHSLTEALARMAPPADLWALSHAETGTASRIWTVGHRPLCLLRRSRIMHQRGPVLAGQELGEGRVSLAGWGTLMLDGFASAIGCRQLIEACGHGRDGAGGVYTMYSMDVIEAALVRSQKYVFVNSARGR